MKNFYGQTIKINDIVIYGSKKYIVDTLYKDYIFLARINNILSEPEIETLTVKANSNNLLLVNTEDKETKFLKNIYTVFSIYLDIKHISNNLNEIKLDSIVYLHRSSITKFQQYNYWTVVAKSRFTDTLILSQQGEREESIITEHAKNVSTVPLKDLESLKKAWGK